MRLLCPACQKSLDAPDSVIGKRVKCPKCGNTFTAEDNFPEPPLPPPLPSELVSAPQPAKPPAIRHGMPLANPEPVQISVNFPQQQPAQFVVQHNQPPRLQSGGWFARSFMSTTGVILAIFLLCGGGGAAIVVAACGGCLYVGGSTATGISKAIEDAEKEAQQKQEDAITIIPAKAETKENETGPSKIPATQPAEKAKNEKKFATATDSIVIGNIEARITAVEVARVAIDALFGRETSESAEEHLILRVTVENKSENRRIEFAGWPRKHGIGTNCTARDEHGNRYKMISFGIGSQPLGDKAGETIEPGGVVTAVLVFEKPIKAATTIEVEADGEAVGQAGTWFRWRLEKKDWVKE